jgi:hypothetical protein
MVMENHDSVRVSIPLTEFQANDQGTGIDPSMLEEISFIVQKGAGDWGAGRFFLDDIAFDLRSATAVLADHASDRWRWRLYPAYPNPFNGSATIRYEVQAEADLHIAVLNIRGQTIETLFNGKSSPGIHTLNWHGSSHPAGLYFVELTCGSQKQVIKCLLVK